jgi:hypothetical protein
MQDIRTGNVVTNVTSIRPCYMIGDGNAIIIIVTQDYTAD